MPEPITEPSATADAAELATLRKLRDELLTRTQSQKARIAELENEALQLREAADKAVATMRAAVIELPLKRLAATLSPVPDLWLSELAKDYTIEANADGTMALLTKDGKPVTVAGNKPIEFTHAALYNLLVGVNGKAETERAKVYKHLMVYVGASGGVGRNQSASHVKGKGSAEEKGLPVTFGLR